MSIRCKAQDGSSPGNERASNIAPAGEARIDFYANSIDTRSWSTIAHGTCTSRVRGRLVRKSPQPGRLCGGRLAVAVREAAAIRRRRVRASRPGSRSNEGEVWQIAINAALNPLPTLRTRHSGNSGARGRAHVNSPWPFIECMCFRNYTRAGGFIERNATGINGH